MALEILESDLDDVPEIARKWANVKKHRAIVKAGKWREGMAAYLCTIARVDFLIGKLLHALDAGPYADNTIIVFWGDHGWHLAGFFVTYLTKIQAIFLIFSLKFPLFNCNFHKFMTFCFAILKVKACIHEDI